MYRLALCLLVASAAAAQESPLFPRLSATAGRYGGHFTTDVRLDPDATGEGTRIGFERDLGLEPDESLQRYTLEWRPAARHELAGSYFASSRRGFQQINREFVFRNNTYPVDALVTTGFDLKYWSATYTYWARRSARDGFGITLGAAGLSLDANVIAQRPDFTVTANQSASTDVPVALAGVQGRVALSDRLLAGAAVSTLPRVTISGYTGRALTGNAQLEYRALRWLGVGAAYNYFRLNVDVARTDLRGAIDMTMRGPEWFVRLAF
ncbi:MAG TPA: hypothetical protein VJZ76_01310 [Thermoanaerobaculia bacterium]|nr:hypothetical protein [Thermoanaerobaculia bacterium]